jgi:hypothetical protein
MPKVKYVGVKPVKTDNVAMTKTVWVGNGDVQEVDETTWAKLAKHPDIWERVEDARPKPSLADVVVNTPAPVAISDIVAKKKPGSKPKAETE